MIAKSGVRGRYPQQLKKYPLKYPLTIADVGELQ